MRIIRFILLSFALIACHKPSANELIIGTIAGPETELVEVAKKVAKQRYDIDVRIVEFNDYNLPNEALQDKSLDANIYQHLPYLQEASKAHGYDFEVIGKTFIYPTGIYSNRYKSIQDIPQNAVIAIPNDPSNETRALFLLQQAGLIHLKNLTHASIKDIDNNPRLLQFKELDAAQLPRVLRDVGAAVINTNYAIPAGLNPLQDALLSEQKDSPYANIIVIRKDSPKKQILTLFVKAMNSQAVKEKAHELFGNAAAPAW